MKTNSEHGIEYKPDRFQAINPSTGEAINVWFEASSLEEVEKAIEQAGIAFDIYRKLDKNRRADFLELIAQEIMNLGDALIHRCVAETGYSEARIIGERGRTVNQLKLFAEMIREGSWVNVRIDTAQPERSPVPRPDIRQLQVPLGPVGVFEAGNFPLAFSTAGGDTASALAAGCPVIAKSHSGHPGTSALIANALYKAIEKAGMPEGTFKLVHGPGESIGTAIVNHPVIKAIGFTGSFSGGKALYDAAVRRKEPIPVYAEMGSINPVFVLPDALLTKGEEIASKLVDSIVLGTGQFCTNPGIIFMQDSESASKFRTRAAEKLSAIEGSTMLSERIKKSFDKGIQNLEGASGVSTVARGKRGQSKCQGVPQLFEAPYDVFASNDTLTEEVFGPSSVFVVVKTAEEMRAVVNQLEGHLTMTIHATPVDVVKYKDLIEGLHIKAGRIIMNGVPTGVEVCHSMVHGGPYPATTDGRSTSVGTLSIYRFTRPVCYQDFPEVLLPAELKNKNESNIHRMINGELTRSDI